MARQNFIECPQLPASASVRSLFVSYDGLTDPLGRSQILPYLQGLSLRGHSITVLSCEKPDRLMSEGAVVRAICDAAQIRWIPLRYHRSPPVMSSVFDLAKLTAAAARLHRKWDFHLIHCRSYLPGIVGLRLKRRFGVPFVFDMRGFWPEERTESGDWNLRNPVFGAIYRYFKKVEKDLLEEADVVISLTQAGAREIEGTAGDAAIVVIPCCVDLAHFTLASDEARVACRVSLGIDLEAPVLGYLGSLGGNHLLDEMLAFFVEYRALHAGALLLLITQTPRAYIEQAAAARNIPLEQLRIRAATRDEVPSYLAAVDHGVAFKRALHSSKACSPTKLGEMLATGIPVISNAGVGDVADILDGACGTVIESFDAVAYRSAIRKLPKGGGARARSRQSAAEWFSLEDGVAAYDGVYRTVRSRHDDINGRASQSETDQAQAMVRASV